MNIKNIIFDIGGVLANPKSGHWFITPNFWKILNKNFIDEEQLNNSLRKYMHLKTQEPKTELEEYNMFSNYYYNVLKDINYPKLTKGLCNKIASDCVYNDEKFIFYNDVVEILRCLSNNYNLYIISNGWPSSFRVLRNKNIDKYFKDILISSMFTTTKEERLFDIFLDKHKDIVPKESLYIDDRRHILNKAEQYQFNLLLMDRKNIYFNSNYQIVKNMNDIAEALK